MLRRLNKITALALSCVVLAGATNLQVSAGSTQSGTIEGTKVTGNISTSSSSATATTSFSRSSSTIKATSTVFYVANGYCYGTTTSSTSSAGGASAIASKKASSGQVIGGRGYHSVKWGAYTWAPADPTTIGTVPTTYNPL